MSESVDNTATETGIDALKIDEPEDFVDPWNVESQSDTGIDYDKLIRKHRLKYSSEIMIFFLFLL